MFSFFKKKEAGLKVNDIVWMNEERKMEALAKAAKENSQTIFIAWFDESYDKLSQYFKENNLSTDRIFLSQQTSQRHLQASPVLFIEHYPLHEKEMEVYEKLGLQTATVHSALDEPFMKTFGSERIISLMKQLGAKEDESFQHNMISASIKSAQEKLKKKLSIEHSARSQGEWLRRNADL